MGLEELVFVQHLRQCDFGMIHDERSLEQFEPGLVAERDTILIVLDLDDGNVEPVKNGVSTLLEFQTAAQNLF